MTTRAATSVSGRLLALVALPPLVRFVQSVRPSVGAGGEGEERHERYRTEPPSDLDAKPEAHASNHVRSVSSLVGASAFVGVNSV